MPEEFDQLEIIYNQLQTQLAEVEEYRLKLNVQPSFFSKIKMSNIILVFSTIGFVVLAYTSALYEHDKEKKETFIVLATLCLGIMFMAIIYKSGNKPIAENKDYPNFFKTTFTTKLVALLYPDMKLDYAKFVSDYYYKRCELYPITNYYTGEDYFSGQINGVDVEFSEVNSYNEKKVNNNGYYAIETYTVFKGLFFVIRTTKHFQGITRIFSNNRPSTRDGSDNAIGKSRHEQMEIEDSTAFKNAYTVYSTNQDEIRSFLTMDTQVKLAQFNNLGTYCQLSFTGNVVFVTIQTNYNNFEPNINTPVYKMDAIRKIYDELMSSFSIVEQLIKILKDSNYI